MSVYLGQITSAMKKGSKMRVSTDSEMNNYPEEESPKYMLMEPEFVYNTYGSTVKDAVRILDLEPQKKTSYSSSAEALIAYIRGGIPRSAVDSLMAASGLTALEISSYFNLSDRSLRRYNPTQALPPEQSEKLVELAMLYARGEEVFGGMERFRQWMSRPQIAFGDVPPKNYLDTSIGMGLIHDELGKIEHGVFA